MDTACSKCFATYKSNDNIHNMGSDPNMTVQIVDLDRLGSGMSDPYYSTNLMLKYARMKICVYMYMLSTIDQDTYIHSYICEATHPNERLIL